MERWRDAGRAGLIGLVTVLGPCTDVATACGEQRSQPAVVLAAAALPAVPGAGADATRSVRFAARSMRHDDPVIQQALLVLGQAINPVKVVDRAGLLELYAHVPGAGSPDAGVNACRAPGDRHDPNIYVNRDSAAYAGATARPTPLRLLKLAATLVHEQVHDADGQFAAYRVQADFVRSRVSSLPWREQQEARRYLQALDARASALAWVQAVHQGTLRRLPRDERDWH